MTTRTRRRLRIGPHGSFFFCGCVCAVDDDEEDVTVEVDVMADNSAREVVEVPEGGARSVDAVDWGVMDDMVL